MNADGSGGDAYQPVATTTVYFTANSATNLTTSLNNTDYSIAGLVFTGTGTSAYRRRDHQRDRCPETPTLRGRHRRLRRFRHERHQRRHPQS